MILYHGSNVFVPEPRILDQARKLDFGKGFYLTTDSEQAERWAVLTSNRRGRGTPCITVYEVDETRFENMRILRFEKPSVEWLKFVSKNRKGILPDDEYDIIAGPVANDRTMPVISLYFSGIYNEEEAIRRLMPQKLKDQYAFKTEDALGLLKVKGEIQL